MEKNPVKFWKNISWLNGLLKEYRLISLSEWMQWPIGEVVALELGEAPTIDQLSQLHRTFGLSYQQLISMDISRFKEQLIKKLDQGPTRLPGQDSHPICEIPLYPQKAGAGSLTMNPPISSQTYHTAHIAVPQNLLSSYSDSSLMAFEIDGFSMYPAVQSGDIVLGRPIKGLSELRSGQRYFILLKDNSLLFKRAYPADPGNGLQLCSDNKDYPAIHINYGQIKQIWRFVGRLSS